MTLGLFELQENWLAPVVVKCWIVQWATVVFCLHDEGKDLFSWCWYGRKQLRCVTAYTVWQNGCLHLGCAFPPVALGYITAFLVRKCKVKK